LPNIRFSIAQKFIFLSTTLILNIVENLLIPHFEIWFPFLADHSSVCVCVFPNNCIGLSIINGSFTFKSSFLTACHFTN
jgi:hypothetical protein